VIRGEFSFSEPDMKRLSTICRISLIVANVVRDFLFTRRYEGYQLSLSEMRSLVDGIRHLLSFFKTANMSEMN
jgi:hypothetical protein